MARVTTPLLSRRAYAKRRGCSHVAVLKAIREGRISTVDGMIDPDLADREWAANTLPRWWAAKTPRPRRPGIFER